MIQTKTKTTYECQWAVVLWWGGGVLDRINCVIGTYEHGIMKFFKKAHIRGDSNNENKD